MSLLFNRDPLDDHPSLASVISELLAAGLKGAGDAQVMMRFEAATRSVPIRRMEAWEWSLRECLWRADQRAIGASWKILKRPRRFTTWLDLCNRDGRLREAALRAGACGAPSGFLFALALRRLNDWVPEVRQAARETLPAMAHATDPEDVVTVLWGVLAHWTTWGRMEPVDREVMRLMVASDAVSRRLKSLILQSTTGPVAFVLSQCAGLPAFEGWIPEVAKGAVQPAVRVRAFQWLFTGQCSRVVGWRWRWINLAAGRRACEPVLELKDLPNHWSFRETFRRAMADRSAMVRRVAAEHLVREFAAMGNDEAVDLARQVASDPTPSIAVRGRFVLDRLSGGG